MGAIILLEIEMLRAIDEVKTIPIGTIVFDNPKRIRHDLGDIKALAKSIKENGLIEPLVIRYCYLGYLLVVGRRRYEALQLLKITDLVHARHFIWLHESDEQTPENELRQQVIEIEENIRRKSFTWQEEIDGKRQLLAKLQQLRGTPGHSKVPGEKGFSLRKLASLLDEDAGNLARDIQLAEQCVANPTLLKQPTKESARRLLELGYKLAGAQVVTKAAQAPPPLPSATSFELVTSPVTQELPPLHKDFDHDWLLYEGDFRASIAGTISESVDLVYTDLPYGVGLETHSKHQTGVSYADPKDIHSLYYTIAEEAFRVLRGDRFAVFFFGFAHYSELVDALRCAGFKVNPVPVIWFKRSGSCENPHKMFANSYEAALVASKGDPRLILQGRSNVIELAPEKPNEKIHVAQQPVALPMHFMLSMTLPNMTVLDFTAGSGTTGVAALRIHRKAILFEASSVACEFARARLLLEEKAILNWLPKAKP
jgi:site-specific DNA-methyltransferase (adenine-specific)